MGHHPVQIRVVTRHVQLETLELAEPGACIDRRKVGSTDIEHGHQEQTSKAQKHTAHRNTLPRHQSASEEIRAVKVVTRGNGPGSARFRAAPRLTSPIGAS